MDSFDEILTLNKSVNIFSNLYLYKIKKDFIETIHFSSEF